MANLENAWLIALYPLISAVLIMFFTYKSSPLSMGLSVAAVAIGFIHSLTLFMNFHDNHPYEMNFNWIKAGDFHFIRIVS